MKILISAGGTEEPIDGVRYIGNFSTGKTGAFLADRMTQLGAEIVLIRGHRAAVPLKKMRVDTYRTFRDLDEKLQFYLKTERFNALIHLAAVSDFSIDYIEREDGERLTPRDRGKLSSENNISLHLIKNYKIIDRLKSYSPHGKSPIVIGFKLTDTDSVLEREEAVKKILQSGKVDFVVQNDLRDIRGESHPARIYLSTGELVSQTENKGEMATRLFSLIGGSLQ